jgi:hypothetical protein
MKAILEFNLPEERSEFEDAQDGTGLRGSAQDFDNYLRELLKYSDFSDEVHKQVDAIRDTFHEFFADTPVWE